MKTLLLNLGNSDLLLDGEYTTQTSCKDKRQQLMEAKDNELVDFVSRLKFPLLEQVLNKYGEFDVVIAFASDQSAKTDLGHKFLEKDTLEMGLLLQELHRRKVEPFASKIGKVDIEKVSNPADFDKMMSYFSDKLPTIIPENDEDSQFFICITGGTPASTLSLLHSAMSCEKIKGYRQFINLSKTAEPEIIRGQKMINRQSLLDKICHLLDTYDYDGVHGVIQATNTISMPVQQFLQTLLQRYNFNFKKALDLCSRDLQIELGEVVPEIRSELNALKTAQDNTETLPYQDIGILLNEIYWNMKIRFDTGDLLGFLSRFYLLNEKIIMAEGCRNFGCSLNELNKVMFGSEKRYPNRKTVRDYLIQKRLLPSLSVDWLKEAESLIDIRHGIVHGRLISGIDARYIKRSWNSGNSCLFAETKKVVCQYSGDYVDNPFDMYGRRIKEWMQEFI